MKNYVTVPEIIEIYKISQSIVNIIFKKYKIDTFKWKKGLLVNFKDFHKAYTSAYNPSLFSELDKKNKIRETPRKPEKVEEILKFADSDGLFFKSFTKPLKKMSNHENFCQSNLLFN